MNTIEPVRSCNERLDNLALKAFECVKFGLLAEYAKTKGM